MVCKLRRYLDSVVAAPLRITVLHVCVAFVACAVASVVQVWTWLFYSKRKSQHVTVSTAQSDNNVVWGQCLTNAKLKTCLGFQRTHKFWDKSGVCQIKADWRCTRGGPTAALEMVRLSRRCTLMGVNKLCSTICYILHNLTGSDLLWHLNKI